MERSVQVIVSSLANAKAPGGFRNPYACRTAARNLELFLSRRDPSATQMLFVGEAPGYRGAAISGVPFCSLRVLLDDWEDPWGAFGSKSGYSACEPSEYWREATATLFWSGVAREMADWPLPLTWNAVPFHPVGPDPASNRPVIQPEIAIGRPWLELILELFPNHIALAVGRRGELALGQLGMPCTAIRHPSRGGKQEFLAGLVRVAKTYGREGQTQLTG